MPLLPLDRPLRAGLLSCWLLLAARSVWAERLIDIPTARKLPYGSFRLEFADELSEARTQLGFFDVGIGTSFEAGFRSEQMKGQPSVGTMDLTYNYISPISGISPGIAFGVQDAMNATEDGRRYFLCFTYRDQADAIGGDYPVEVTVGAFFANRSSPYVGLSLPFSSNVRLLAEHDGIRISAGLEYRPVRTVGIRFLSRGRDVMGDLTWTGHF